VTEYLDFQIETDPEVIAQLGFDEMASRLPGWDPIAGELDTALIQAVARIASQVRASAGIVPIGVFRYLAGQFGITPGAGSYATIPTTVGVNDALSHVIPAGAQFLLDADGFGTDFRLYQNPSDFTVAAGTPLTSRTGPTLIAVNIGAHENNQGGAFQAVDSFSWMYAPSSSAASGGGVDPEDDAAFFEHIIRRFALNTASPILPADFAALALEAPGVPAGSRAIAIDGYDAVATTSGNARTVTVFIVDPTGVPLSSGVKAGIVTYLAALREINWNIYCSDPVYFQMSFKVALHALPGFDPVTVQTDVFNALFAYASGLTWGKPAIPTLGNWTLLEGWDKVRLGELYEIVNAVNGVAYVDSLFLKAGAVLPTTEVADVTLTGGPVVVPSFGNYSVTVT
jgi:Baseplate J-like protein